MSARCERHGLAAGPDGHCALCGRSRAAAARAVTRQSDRSVRRVVKVALGIVAAVATFAVLMAAFDTNGGRAPDAVDAPDAALG